MKMKIFTGTWGEAQAAFNKWAEGKALMREVIIHEQLYRNRDSLMEVGLMIIVIHPESAYWDSTKSKPIQRIQSEATEDYGLERETKHVMLAPVHDKPEPHIKLEEAQVTQ